MSRCGVQGSTGRLAYNIALSFLRASAVGDGAGASPAVGHVIPVGFPNRSISAVR